MKNFLVGLGFLSILLTAGGCKKKSAPMQAPLPVNVVTAVEKEVNEWDEFTGRLEAVESVEIRPRVSGYITEIRFQAGAIIKKDDVLYVIDPRPYQADFDRAAAELERMRAQEKLAQIELDRAKELRAKNTISASEFDQKAATYQASAAATGGAERIGLLARHHEDPQELAFSGGDGRDHDRMEPTGGRPGQARGPGPQSVPSTLILADSRDKRGLRRQFLQPMIRRDVFDREHIQQHQKKCKGDADQGGGQGDVGFTISEPQHDREGWQRWPALARMPTM